MQKVIEGLQVEGGTIIRYTGDAEELNLPVYVRRIAPYAFYNCKSLKTVVMPSRLESIGKGAFYGCDNLKQAVLPGRLFKRAKGTNVFDDSETIFFRFFTSQGGMELDDDDYSDVYSSEEEYKESGAVQEEISGAPEREIHATESGEKFSNNLEDGYSGDYADYADYDPSLYERIDAVTPEEEPQSTLDEDRRKSLVNERNYLIEGTTVIRYIGAEKKTVVPEYITEIAENAFANCGIVDVKLPDGLKIIGKNAFAWCDKLASVTFPDGLELIEDSAFFNCSSLTLLKIPASVKFIGANAFHACSGVKSLLFAPDNKIKVISRRTFDFCVGIERVFIPATVELLEDGAFSHCENLTKVTLPQGLKEIGAWAFAGCYELREINFPDGLERVGEVAFHDCTSLIAFDFPATVREVGRQAFSGCTGLHLANLPVTLKPQLRQKKVFHGAKEVSIDFFDVEEVPVHASGDGQS